MGLLDFFQKKEPTPEGADRVKWGGTGSLPKLGKMPAEPSLPAVSLPKNPQRIGEPSPEAVKMSNQILDSGSNNVSE